MWCSEDIDFGSLRASAVRQSRPLFYVLLSSSFLEITVPVYTRNLAAYYRDNEELVTWLTQQWLPEEMEHGRAMRAYVTAAWPELDWAAAYGRFQAEIEPYCASERYQPTRALEMLARCVTETGAASVYRALRDWTDEPVLKDLMHRMQRDETRHYTHFLKWFRHYDAVELNAGRRIILATIIQRTIRGVSEDGLIAYKHAYAAWTGDGAFSASRYREFLREIRQMIRAVYPYEAALKMLVQPFRFSERGRRVAVPLLSRLARLWMTAGP